MCVPFLLFLEHREDGGTYKSIFVKPEGGDPQVTFDNNSEDNHWCYHPGNFRRHITGN